MTKPPVLSATMREALEQVPDDWQKPPYKDAKLNRRRVRYRLFYPTFCALVRKGLIEWRGGPGTWEWRKVPATPTQE